MNFVTRWSLRNFVHVLDIHSEHAIRVQGEYAHLKNWQQVERRSTVDDTKIGLKRLKHNTLIHCTSFSGTGILHAHVTIDQMCTRISQ
jgi:hypothetical protein